MTVYEHFQEQALTNRSCAQRAETRHMSESFLADAQKWEHRAGKLTPEEGAKNVEDCILWRIIEQVDGRSV